MIIGIAGTIGSGKGTVVEFLKSKGFAHYSSSKLLGELVEREGNPKIREFLSPMATKLQQEYPGGVVEKNFREKFLIENPEHAVFEAIHRQSEANFLKSVGGVIVCTDADLKTRYERAVLRNEGEKDHVTFENFQKQAYIEEEGAGDASRDNNIRAVITEADIVLMNDGTQEEFLNKVTKTLEELS